MHVTSPQRLAGCLAQRARIATRVLAWPIAALLVTSLAACDQDLPATGQVLVSVGGEAITKRDLQGEYAAAARLGVAKDGAGPALDRLVERTLLLRAAEQRDLALTPEYLAAIRRARGDILLGMFNDQIAAEIPPPSADEIARFIETHPWMFADRQFLTLDEVVQPTGDGAPVHRTVQVDTAQLPAAEARALLAAAGVVQLGGRSATVQASEPAPIMGAQASKVAAAVIRREQLARRLEAIVAKERRGTQIRYRQGFGAAAR